MEPAPSQAVAAADLNPLEDDSIYLLESRVGNTLTCCLAVLACVWLAAFTSSAVAQEHREHMQAGGPVFVAFITVLMVIAAFMIYRALRAARLGVRVTASGITIENMRRDLTIGWSEIAQFEAVKAAGGPYTVAVAVVRLKDGNGQVIQGTEAQLAIWQRKSNKVNRCVARLNALLEAATGSSPHSTTTLPATPPLLAPAL
jgi:hypothetical protein